MDSEQDEFHEVRYEASTDSPPWVIRQDVLQGEKMDERWSEFVYSVTTVSLTRYCIYISSNGAFVFIQVSPQDRQ